MKDVVPITRHPRWDGTNITWVVPHDATIPPSSDIGRERPYPLEDLLRAIGRELDDLQAGSAVVRETTVGFTASAQVSGKMARLHYTHSELTALAEHRRRQRRVFP